MADEAEKEPECRTLAEYVLYKLDRTVAILGIIVIALVALWMGKAPDSLQIAVAAIGGLVGYVGGRSGK